MRYIGNKQNLLEFIHSVIAENCINEKVFCDIFSGTTSVAKYFKERDYTVISNDFMEYSYVFQKAYISNNNIPNFEGLKSELNIASLQDAINYLNEIPGIKGFIFNNYSKEGTKNKKHERNYFSSENAQKIDAIREQIQIWYEENKIRENEFYILLTSLLEIIPSISNISGTYGAFLKIDDPRKFKKLNLEIPRLIFKGKNHRVYKKDSNLLIKEIESDILYVDPPYNSRQYAPNYHILETIAVWDKKIKDNKTGLRDYLYQKSEYCLKNKCVSAFEDLIDNAKCRYILFSYNSEGIIPYNEIIRILSKKGEIKIYTKEYRRFKSNSNGTNEKKILKEYIFYCKVKLE